MNTYRYARWDGTQLIPPFDADDVLDAMSEDILAEGDVRRALQRLMQRGLRGTRGGDVPGLRRIVERLRERRRADLERSNLDGVLDDIAERLEQIVNRERAGIEERLHQAEQAALDAPPGFEQEQARMAEQVLRRTARQRLDRLDALPPSLAGRLHGLRDYEFMDPDARDAFNQLTDELRQRLMETYFQGLKEGVAGLTPDDLDGVRQMVRDLNALLEKHASGADTRADFEAFMAAHGQYFPPGISSVDELIDHLHRQASQMASLLSSMSPQMREELQQLMDDLLRDDRLRWDMARLAGNLQALRPDVPFGEPYPFSGDEPLGLVEALAAIDRQQQYDALEQEMLAARDPEALERLDADLLRDLGGEEAADELEQLRELARALEEAGYLERDGGRLELTPRAARKLGMRALTDIFSRLRRESLGGHPLPQAGTGGEPTDETKAYEHGDAFALDLNRTLFNAMARNGPGTPLRLEPEDFEVRRTEETTVSSTVLLLDMSRSMLLRGCSTAAKRVAMALHTLIHTKYPRDRLYVVGFAYYARQIKPEAIATLSPYEFEYGTNLQHALMIGRQLLGRRRGGNKEIVVITDGEPTAHIANGQVEFAYPPTIRTMQSTLREVGRATREGIVINTFMLERSRYLSEFVDLMSRINRGRAFYVEPERLGEYVLVDYVSKKTKRVA
ncbi:MAG TPA: VWA domain-containing protein [candidate division Zixibacteria bacterium]|nr:VWA domain-containing protein [candidate division Zixibacteria bacterium]